MKNKRTFVKLNTLDRVALLLVVLGALDWGLVGILEVDLVAASFGPMSVFSRVVYALVGLAGIYIITMIFLRK